MTALPDADGGTPPARLVEVGVFGRWIGAEVAAEPLYDPKNLRVRDVPDGA